MFGYIISFAIGFVIALILQKKPVKNNTLYDAVIQSKKDCRIDKINEMLKAIKKNKTLHISVSKSVLAGLKELANTPDWNKNIDAETLDNLYKIYLKWQNSLSQPEPEIKTGKAEGFNYTSYWEGTWEEYLEARKNGEVDDQTRICIYKKTGSKIAMDDNGEITEYME